MTELTPASSPAEHRESPACSIRALLIASLSAALAFGCMASATRVPEEMDATDPTDSSNGTSGPTDPSPDHGNAGDSNHRFSGWVFADALLDDGLDSTSESDAGDGSTFQPWSLVVLPDTQYYSQNYPDIFRQQTQWIVDHAEALNIRFVAHVGDLTNGNTHTEYQVAAEALGTLYDAGIPFAVASGNHDLSGTATTRSSHLTEYIPPAMYDHSEEVGFFRNGETDNSWHLISSGSHRYLLLALEFGPRDDVVEWAKEVIRQHQGAMTILVTHAYLYYDDSRFDWAAKGKAQNWNPHSYPVANLPGGVNDGQELWDALLRDNPDAGMVLSGHTLGDGIGYSIAEGLNGNRVHQMLANYQKGTSSGFPYGGAGMVRIIQFTTPRTAWVATYSDYYQALLDDGANDFYIRFGSSSDSGVVTAGPSGNDGQ